MTPRNIVSGMSRIMKPIRALKTHKMTGSFDNDVFRPRGTPDDIVRSFRSARAARHDHRMINQRPFPVCTAGVTHELASSAMIKETFKSVLNLANLSYPTAISLPPANTAASAHLGVINPTVSPSSPWTRL